MSDTGSALAITEKKPQRPGGCVGIFFQLFDWNRKFAKKKFFQNKLLPLGSKKFGADDKLPKLRLMSDEKSDVFSTGKKNVDSGQKHAMKTPTLVARLMGLDSLPAVQKDKLKKTSDIGVDKGGRFNSDCCRLDGKFIELEKECSKHESKPQKLQKTGFSERRAVTRFGAEGLQFRNVLSRSSKHHHPKFAPPVKSPKSLSKRNASRLIGAATRILEPGLQARNRAKCALSYSSHKHQNPTDGALSKDQVEGSTRNGSVARLSRGHSSCGNCGNTVDVQESGSYLKEQPSASDYVVGSSFGLGSRKRPHVLSIETEESNFRGSAGESSSVAVQSLNNLNPLAEHNLDRTTVRKSTRWQLTSQQLKKQEVLPSPIRKQNQEFLEGDRTLPRSTYSVHLIKDVPFYQNQNQNPSDQKCSRLPAKLDKCRYVSERRSIHRPYDPLSSARKKRSVNVARQDNIGGYVGSTVDRQRKSNCSALSQTMVRGDVQSRNITRTDSSLARLGETKKGSDINNGVVSFTFSSSKKQKDRMLAESHDRGYQSECTCSNSSQKNSILDEIHKYESACSYKSYASTGDTLGVLLEQKLKELSSQEDIQMALGGSSLNQRSAIILQELISALTVQRSFHVNDVVVRPTEIGDSSCCVHTSTAHPPFQAHQNNAATQARYPNDGNNNNMSPLSVLEACISNESCLSSSLDDGSVHKLQTDFIDMSCNDQQQVEPGATSLTKERPGIELVADFVNSISEILCSMDLVDSRLKGCKLAHAERVILNSELLFGDKFRLNSDETKGFSIHHFIVNELETLGSVLWTNFGRFSESEDTEGNLLKGFLFDCVIEYLDSRYIPSIVGGIITHRDLPLSMNTDMLIREVVEEIRSWTSWAGFVLDELIEKEMGNWTEFDVEAFETVVSVDGDILHSLVDEIVVDLWQSKLNL